MELLSEATNNLSATILPLVLALLVEELTLAGLVRLVIAPRPRNPTPQERPTPSGDPKCSH